MRGQFYRVVPKGMEVVPLPRALLTMRDRVVDGRFAKR